MKIDFLYWEGCPSHPEALALLEDVLRERGLEPDLDVRQITSHEEAEAHDFRGSPTIRIDGHDVDPQGAANQRVALACRIYQLTDGRVSPVPTRGMIEEALS